MDETRMNHANIWIAILSTWTGLGREISRYAEIEILHETRFYLFFNKSDTCGFYMAD